MSEAAALRPSVEIETVAVIGAGVAGRGFALACAAAGFRVVLEDVMPANLRKAEADYADLTQRGTAGRKVSDLEVLPADTPSPARADGLHARFFGGKPSGVAFKAVGLALDIRDLSRREHPLAKTLSEALEGCANARHFR